MATTLVPRSLADFRPGTEIRTRARTVTESDIAGFAGLTWDFYPLHTDEEYAKQTPYGTRIAHGPLVYAFSIGLMPIDFFGDSIIGFLGVGGLRHLLPVYIGDTLEVHATVQSARPTSDGTRGVIEVEYLTKNQKGVTVLEMLAKFLVRSEGEVA